MLGNQLYAFGSNSQGQLGISSTEDAHQITPVPLPSSSSSADIVAIKCGLNHTLIQTSHGIVYGSGRRADNQLGQAVSDGGNGKEPILGFEKRFEGVDMCACAGNTSAIVRHESAGSVVHTIGEGKHGELGRGSEVITTITLEERSISFESRVVDIAAGLGHYVVVLEDGTVYGWGNGRRQQLGPERKDQWSSFELDIPFKAVKAVCGQRFTLIAGSPESGEYIVLSDERESFDPHGLRKGGPKDIKGWKEIHASWNAIYVLFEDGTLLHWGSSNMGQKPPDSLPPVETMAVGSVHILAKLKFGKVVTFGWGHHGNCLAPTGPEPLCLVENTWNEVPIEGHCTFLGAGCATSFVEVQEEAIG